ncbi:hypothetical protein [Aquariibacter albus]|uniref:Transporter n=1 Tax=Aquariibacter albus TaxID=2759899 RepID=A0A839HPV9_9BURK|nr:hypothetical protein [Aquariibacter albus]MBB1161051.1 hypothetical protein [Aquariibacter albus]
MPWPAPHAHRRRPIRRSVAVLGLLGLATAPAWAARPMVTDDARLVDPQACQLETWRRVGPEGGESWALPACNPAGGLELTLGGARQRGEGPATDAVLLQAKTLFRPLTPGDWGYGLAVGTVQRPGPADEFYAYLPFSRSFGLDELLLHANLGLLHEGATRRERLSWGLGLEWAVAPRLGGIAEVFDQAAGRPMVQIGLRSWLLPGRLQLDATAGERLGGEPRSRWLSLGLRLLTPPFLP